MGVVFGFRLKTPRAAGTPTRDALKVVAAVLPCHAGRPEARRQLYCGQSTEMGVGRK
jgi:hypothetical protein